MIKIKKIGYNYAGALRNYTQSVIFTVQSTVNPVVEVFKPY